MYNWEEFQPKVAQFTQNVRLFPIISDFVTLKAGKTVVIINGCKTALETQVPFRSAKRDFLGNWKGGCPRLILSQNFIHLLHRRLQVFHRIGVGETDVIGSLSPKTLSGNSDNSSRVQKLLGHLVAIKSSVFDRGK